LATCIFRAYAPEHSAWRGARRSHKYSVVFQVVGKSRPERKAFAGSPTENR